MFEAYMLCKFHADEIRTKNIARVRQTSNVANTRIYLGRCNIIMSIRSKSSSKTLQAQIREIEACGFPNAATYYRTEYTCKRFGNRFVADSTLGDYKALLITDKKEFKQALKVARDMFLRLELDDARIDEIEGHETAHIEAAKGILRKYDADSRTYYGIAFFEKSSGSALAPFSTTLFRGQVPNFSAEDLYAITNAPKKKSSRDLSTLARLKRS
jgi:hypothetical protein